MMNRRMILALTAFAFVPVSAHAQSVSANSATQANAAIATPDARINAAMQAAADAEIPQGLLESKVREAEAKQATPEQTAAAVEARLAALIDARSTLESANIGAFTEGELLVTAEALAAGVSREAIVEVAGSANAQSRATATATLTDLVRLGHGAAHAGTQVGAALAGGVNALLDLRANATSQLTARGLAPTSIGGSAAAGVTGVIRR